MILTGKCKEKFWEWYKNREGKTLTPKELELISEEVLQNALIIEFFDSAGIYVNVLRYGLSEPSKWVVIKSLCENNLDFIYSSRQEATEQAIKKANDLYNSRYENV